MLTATGRRDEALSVCEIALQLLPNDADSHCLHGVRLHDLGRRQEGLQELRAALRLDPDHTRARQMLTAFESPPDQ